MNLDNDAMCESKMIKFYHPHFLRFKVGDIRKDRNGSYFHEINIDNLTVEDLLKKLLTDLKNANEQTENFKFALSQWEEKDLLMIKRKYIEKEDEILNRYKDKKVS